MSSYVYTYSSGVNIPTNVASVKVIAVGEGGQGAPCSSSSCTNGLDGANTTFLGITASGGQGGQGTTAGGIGGTPTFTYGTVLTSSIGNNGATGSPGSGGSGHTYTSNTVTYTNIGSGEDGSQSSYSQPTTTSQCNCNPKSGLRGGNAGQCPNNPCGSLGYTPCSGQCTCSNQPNNTYTVECEQYNSVSGTQTAYVYGAGGGAGGYIEVLLTSKDLSANSLYGIQNYTVNGNTIDNGQLEIIYFFHQVYIKTSQGWQRSSNVYVKANSSSWSLVDPTLVDN